MKIKIKDNPRSFYPTGNKEIMIKDMGEIELIADVPFLPNKSR